MQSSAIISLTVVNLLRKIWSFMLLSKVAPVIFLSAQTPGQFSWWLCSVIMHHQMGLVLPLFPYSEIPDLLAIKKKERPKRQRKNLLKIWLMVFVFVSHTAKKVAHRAHSMSGWESVHLHLFHLGHLSYQQCSSVVIEMKGFNIAVLTHWVWGGENRVLYHIFSFLFVYDFNIHDGLTSLWVQFRGWKISKRLVGT